LSKGERQAVANASVGQAKRRAVNRRFDSDRREQTWDRCARTHHVAQANAVILASREITGSVARDVVTRDSNPAHAVVEPVECRGFQLCQALWNDATQPGQCSRQPAVQPHIKAVDQEVAPAEVSRVANELVDRQTDGGIVRGDNSTCTRSDDDVDRDFVLDKLLQDTHVACAPQTPTAQHKADPECRTVGEPFARGVAGDTLIADICLPRSLSRASPRIANLSCA
jgi:enhancing lycopene biosynthesis protein 2